MLLILNLLPFDDSDLEIIIPNSFLRPNVNDGLVFKRNERDIILKTPSRYILVKSLEIQDIILRNFSDFWYHEYLLNPRE